jgi:hypothetical protein
MARRPRFCAARMRRCRKISPGANAAVTPGAAAVVSILGIFSRETARPLFFRQSLAPIFKAPEQSGYGDKRPS